jgi:hypothetical protein
MTSLLSAENNDFSRWEKSSLAAENLFKGFVTQIVKQLRLIHGIQGKTNVGHPA